MIKTITHGTTRIGIAPIIEGDGNRRQREKETVTHILREMGVKGSLEHDTAGAPILSGMHVSVSHSRNLAVVALDTVTSIGIDAEEWREQLPRIAPRFLSESELEWMKDTAEPGTGNPLLKAWTVKEAAYKATGGIGTEFATEIAIHPGFSNVEVKEKSGAVAGLYDIWFFTEGDTLIALVK